MGTDLTYHHFLYNNYNNQKFLNSDFIICKSCMLLCQITWLCSADGEDQNDMLLIVHCVTGLIIYLSPGLTSATQEPRTNFALKKLLIIDKMHIHPPDPLSLSD